MRRVGGSKVSCCLWDSPLTPHSEFTKNNTISSHVSILSLFNSPSHRFISSPGSRTQVPINHPHPSTKPQFRASAFSFLHTSPSAGSPYSNTIPSQQHKGLYLSSAYDLIPQLAVPDPITAKSVLSQRPIFFSHPTDLHARFFKFDHRKRHRADHHRHNPILISLLILPNLEAYVKPCLFARVRGPAIDCH